MTAKKLQIFFDAIRGVTTTMNNFIAAYNLCEQILRLPAVIALTGKCRSSIYTDIKSNRFPKQRKLNNSRSVGWAASEIHDYIRITLAGGEYVAV
jgi:predicted DNA-binding transcriptional regulator AlpA